MVFSKKCLQLRFSHGGHLFCAVNISNLIIYSTYTFEKVGVLISHTSTVKSICWANDDSKLVSSGLDGAVYEWAIPTYERKEENVVRNARYSSCVYNKAGMPHGPHVPRPAFLTVKTGTGVVTCCQEDGRIREIVSSNVGRELSLATTAASAGGQLNQILLSNQDNVLFVANSKGSIFRCPRHHCI